MKFANLPVTSLEDATHDFEQLQAAFTKPGSTFPFLQLLSAKQLAIDVGGGSVTFTASVASANAVVSHSLGRTPTVVLATSATTSAIPLVIVSATTTTFTIRGEYWSSISGTFPFNWLAIG